jgi:hypothetical protein
LQLASLFGDHVLVRIARGLGPSKADMETAVGEGSDVADLGIARRVVPHGDGEHLAGVEGLAVRGEDAQSASGLVENLELQVATFERDDGRRSTREFSLGGSPFCAHIETHTWIEKTAKA